MIDTADLTIGRYAEDVDSANALVEMEVNYAVAQARQAAQQQLLIHRLIAVGTCHYCGNKIDDDLLFCDDECQHDHAEEENKRQHLRNIGAH
jgi:predicted nucleic acid-binding Zn ribbon protein